MNTQCNNILEKSIVTYCSPTLAAMSTGNLFNCPSDGLYEQIERCNCCLNRKGVLMRVLREKNGCALVYVFRPSKLWKNLNESGVMDFLQSIGYKKGNLCSMINQLTDRVRESGSIPHEIGIFLGYPLDDVKGFIENKGKNYKCEGCWKVYSDEKAAQKLFTAFRCCTRLYAQRFMQGLSVQQLTVPA